MGYPDSNVGSFSYTNTISLHMIYEMVPLGFEGGVRLAASSSISKASEL
jgi:hypothetical protein